MTEIINYDNDKINKYVSEKYDINNINICLFSPGTIMYEASLSKYYKELKRVKNTCSHITKDTVPIVVKVKDLDSISIDKSIYLYFCPNCEAYITDIEINTPSVKTILYKNSLGRNLHVNKLEQKRLTCMNKIKNYMQIDCECTEEKNKSDKKVNIITDNIKMCSRCYGLQQQLVKLALLEVQMELLKEE